MFILSNLKSRARVKLIKLILKLKNIDWRDNILLLADPRGGSTFLMEVLSSIPGTAIIWEPLHGTKGLIPKDFNLGWMPYIPETEEREELQDLF